MDKPYMLLRPLPLYSRCEIRPLRSWLGILGIQEDTFKHLINEGWFK